MKYNVTIICEYSHPTEAKLDGVQHKKMTVTW